MCSQRDNDLHMLPMLHGEKALSPTPALGDMMNPPAASQVVVLRGQQLCLAEAQSPSLHYKKWSEVNTEGFDFLTSC